MKMNYNLPLKMQKSLISLILLLEPNSSTHSNFYVTDSIELYRNVHSGNLCYDLVEEWSQMPFIKICIKKFMKIWVSRKIRL